MIATAVPRRKLFEIAHFGKFSSSLLLHDACVTSLYFVFGLYIIKFILLAGLIFIEFLMNNFFCFAGVSKKPQRTAPRNTENFL